MKFFPPLLICFFFSAYIFSQSNQLDSLTMQWEHYTLANGLQVVLQPDITVNNVSVEFWLLGGNRIDERSEYGLAHFFEHVTPWSPMDSARSAQLASYRTGSNAQVRKDYIRYFVQVKPEGLELALEQSSGRLKAGPERITEAKVEHERNRVLAEIDRNSKNVRWSAKGGMAIQAGTFGANHPYGHNGYGRRENNENFTVADFQERYNEVVFANNTILFVVGNFDVKEAKEHIEQYFKDIRPREKTSPKINRPKQSKESITMNAPSPEDEKNTLIFTWAIPKWGSPDDAAMRLLTYVLDERLSREGYFPNSVVNANSSKLLEFYEFAGQFGALVTFSAKKDSTLIQQLLQQEVARLIKAKITKDELERAKQKEIEYIKEMQENLGFQWSRTELLGEGLLFTGQPDFYLTRLKTQANLDSKDIKNVAKKWLKTQPFRILFLSEKSTK